MKSLALTNLFLLGLAVGAQAVTYNSYIQNFDTFGPKDSPVAGQDEWAINNTNDQYSFVPLFGLGFGLGLGDASAVTTVPASPGTVALSHSYVGTIGDVFTTLDFNIQDSYDAGFKNRDKFSVSFTVGATELLSIIFVPVDPTPANPIGPTTFWNVDYSSAFGSGTLALSVPEAQTTGFTLDFNPSGANTSFTLSLQAFGPAASDTKTLVGLNPATLSDTFSVNWTSTGSNAFGSNSFNMDNLSIVPEPSSSFLLGLAGLGFVSRRRRSA